MCPDLSTVEKGGVLYGSQSDLVSSQVIMQMRKCSNSTLQPGEPRCKPIEEIDEFIKDIVIKTWVVQSKVDFTKYAEFEKPLQDVMEKISVDMLKYNHLLSEEFFVRHNYIYSQENWLPMFGHHQDTFYDISKSIKSETDIKFH